MNRSFDINTAYIDLRKISGNALKLLLLLFQHKLSTNPDDDFGLFENEKRLSTKDIYENVGLDSFETTIALKELVDIEYISFKGKTYFDYLNGFEYLKEYFILTNGIEVSMCQIL